MKARRVEMNMSPFQMKAGPFQMKARAVEMKMCPFQVEAGPFQMKVRTDHAYVSVIRET